MSRFASLLTLGLLSALWAGPEPLAQMYPAKPVRLIVPTLPGSPPDVYARRLADKLAGALGQPVVIENRPGAGGTVGTEAAAKAAPDGYTIVLVHLGTLAINPHIYSRTGYDPIADFAPITRVSSSPLLLAVHPDVPAHSVAELIELAKAKPGHLNFGSPGNGTPPYMAHELFKLMAKIDVTHVPYRGSAAALTDLIAGRITYTIESPVFQLPPAKAGKIRTLALTSRKRFAAMPDIPTVAESGLPGFEFVPWLGIAAPAATPPKIIAMLHAEIAKVVHAPEMQEWFAANDSEPGGEPPEEFAAFIKAEHEKWGKVVRAAGIKAE